MGSIVQSTADAQVGSSTTFGQSFVSGPTSGNLLVWWYGCRDADSSGVPSISLPAGWTKADESSPMEYHMCGIAYKTSDGTESGTITATASESSHSWWHGLLEWNESGVSDWTLDVATADGSNTSNVSSIQPGATGTLSSATGVAMVAGTSRTGSEGLSLSVLTDLDSEDTAFVIDAGSANYIAGYQDLSATTSINETVSESNGSSRMGAVMAVFVENTGGGGGGGLPAGSLGLLGVGI